MKLETTDREIEVIQINKLSKEYQVVIEKDDDLVPGGIIVFVLNCGTEILGVIKDHDDNDEHRVMYVETNPSLDKKEITINNLESILLWGTLS
jgi:hypothetical protein